MSNNVIGNISNAFSTGGGGVNFEQQIQAMFLLSMLVDGFCPIVNEQTMQVCFQAKHIGYDTDDVVVNTAKGKMLCQIKHRITATKSDRTFRAVICAAWKDFISASFNKDADVIALAVAQISFKSQQALRFLHAQAIASADVYDFYERVKMPDFSSTDNSNMLDSIEGIIADETEVFPSKEDVFAFCRSFVLLVFDLDCEESINRYLSSALIKCHSSRDARLVWSRLVEYAGQCNQTAASIDRNNVDPDILALFENDGKIQMPPTPIQELDLFIPTIALIGSWDESNEFDRQVIEAITNDEYGGFEAKARNMLIQYPNYLKMQNGLWKVLNKENLLNQSKEALFDSTLESIIKTVEDMLGQESKNMKNGQWNYLVTREFDNSVALRRNLLDSLCWIKYSLGEIKQCNQEKIESRLNQLVRSVLKDGDMITWFSLRDSIQCLAELAPEIFIDRVEWCVINKTDDVLQLFPQDDAGIFNRPNTITHILWALESLAWSPDYLVRVVRVLGMLESVPYARTNWANTPINSIVSILLPWYPQTLAPVEQRKVSLRCLKTDRPDVFWNVLIKLLPKETTSTTGTQRPRFLKVQIPSEISVTNREVIEQYASYLEMAVDIARIEIDKLADLTTQMGYMSEDTLKKYLESITAAKGECDEKQRLNLWIGMRKCITRKAPERSSVINKNIDSVNEVIRGIEPETVFYRNQEFYLADDFLFDDDDYFERWKKLEAKRVEAVKNIYDNYDVVRVEQFGADVKKTQDVASKLGQGVNPEELTSVIDEFEKGTISSSFAVACVASFAYSVGAERLLDTSLCSKDKDFILSLLCEIPVSKSIYDVACQLLGDDSIYWQRVRIPYVLVKTDIDFLTVIVAKLVSCKRYVSAVNLIGRSDCTNVIEVNVVCSLLKLAGTEKSNEAETIDSYAAQRLIKWLQEQADITIEILSEIEFIYLPVIDDYSDVHPKALNTRLGTDPDYFCSMIELFYKKETDEKNRKELNEGLAERLFKVLFQFKVVPGMSADGTFNKTVFKSWLRAVKEWSRENDRFIVTMHTVGSGLSYAQLDDDGLPDLSIIEELNMVENEELRRGFFLGLVNKRGVHIVEPDGKPEFELSNKYKKKAEIAEKKGYSRYADVLREVSDHYIQEAKRNIISNQNETEH